MKYVLEVLFPYLVILYVCDCIAYLRTNHILLTSWFGKKFHFKRSGFRLAGVLPTSQAILTHSLPFHCTTDGIYAIPDQAAENGVIVNAEDFTFIPYDELALVEVDGKNIKLDPFCSINTPSSADARYLTEFINELKNLSRSDRKSKISNFLRDSFDLKRIKNKQVSHTSAFSIVKFLSSFLFLVVFCVLPLVLYTDLSKYANFDGLVGCIVVLYLLLLAATFITMRKSYKFDKDAKRYTLLSIMLSPVNALHVMEYLTKNLYFKFNYLALAANFLPRHIFKNLIRKELLLMGHLESKIIRHDWIEFWNQKKQTIHRLLEACGISPDELLAAPVQQDQSAISYCPYCLTEYSKQRYHCIDCNITLKEFEAGGQPSA